jgi:hypothetical protein
MSKRSIASFNGGLVVIHDDFLYQQINVAFYQTRILVLQQEPQSFAKSVNLTRLEIFNSWR